MRPPGPPAGEWTPHDERVARWGDRAVLAFCVCALVAWVSGFLVG